MKNFILKNFIVFFVVVMSVTCVIAKSADVDYKNIKNNSKIYLCRDNLNWTTSKKSDDSIVFVKKAPDNVSASSEFYSQDGNVVFSTGTQYEFVHNGRLIGYSNNDLKFYQYVVNNNGELQKQELLFDEVKDLFGNVEVIRISEFSNATNALKIKKEGRSLKILLLNDTDKIFPSYLFTSRNAKFKEYALSGFIEVTKPGMIQFSSFGDNTKNSPWYVLLVR